MSEEQIVPVWAQIREKILRGQRYGCGDTMSEQKLYAAVKKGDVEMWAVSKDGEVVAGVFIQIVQRPLGLALIVKELAGEGWDDWGDQLQEKVREYARRVGTYTVEAVVRPGLEKWLEPLGWKRKAIVMEADRWVL